MKNIGVGIIGAGPIGWKRADVIKKSKLGKLVAVADIDLKKAELLANKHHCLAYQNWRDILSNKNISAVIISVPNNLSSFISIEALKQEKNVLCEKPLGRNAAEDKKVLKETQKHKKIFKVGFNHRFYSSISNAKKIYDKGEIGKLIFIRARYGHGGRYKMEKEWRMDKKISGGGELRDQGVHIIDLIRWFGGEPDKIFGMAEARFWKANVDDNAFVIMSNKKVTATFHVSSTNWKNIFSLEVFGDKGYLEINGTGGSYGKETLIFGKRKEKFGVPDIKIFKFKNDVSWLREWENFLDAIFKKSKINGSVVDGYRANLLVDKIYKISKL